MTGRERIGTICGAARAAALGIGIYSLAAVLVAWLASNTYGFFTLSDIGYYREIAGQMARGLRPYRDFPVEYPPLATGLIWATAHIDAPYEFAFAGMMFGFGAAAAAAVGLASQCMWSDGRRFVASATYAAGILAAGAIVPNRLDAVVAFVIAAALLLLVLGRCVAAAAVLGLGFAFKLTPAILLPLVLIPSQRRLTAVAAFTAAAVAPFVAIFADPLLPGVFQFHFERPLQVESVLATPLTVAHVTGFASQRVGTSHGSQSIVGPLADILAISSGPLGLAALALTYGVLWSRRSRIGQEHIPLAALAILLAFLTFGKVLSPQFFVWLLPASALVAPTLPILGALTVTLAALTQIEFPALYWDFVNLKPVAVAVVALRNGLVPVAWGLALVKVWRLAPGATTSSGSVGGPQQGLRQDQGQGYDG